MTEHSIFIKALREAAREYEFNNEISIKHDEVIDMEQDNGDDSAYSNGVRHMAGTVRHIITDTLGNDNA